MGKSTTGKKSELKRAQHLFEEFGLQYIKQWTQQELKRYQKEPVVIPIGDHGFLIGPYSVQGIHTECWQVTSCLDERFVYHFISKPAAIFYCLYNIKEKYLAARELLEIDTKLGRIDLDVKHYEHALKIAQKRNDTVKYTIVLNRYIDAKMQRRTYQNILKKTLNSAKYLNFGNQPL